MTQEYFPGGERENVNEIFQNEILDIRDVDWDSAPIVERRPEHKYAWLRDKLGERVIGQPDAVNAVVDSLHAEKLRDKRRPIATIMFLGPTGVGKTETAEALADILREYQDEAHEKFGRGDKRSRRPRPYTRIDCSEFKDSASVNRLTGSAPGYVGFGKKSQFDKSVIEQHQSVVLFDEFEKAHPDFQDVLLQITSNGEMTLGAGDKVSFRQSIVIITSNLGSREMMKLLGKTNSIGFRSDSGTRVSQQDIQKSVETALKENVRPELYNRINKKVVFSPLDDDTYAEVLERSVQRSAGEAMEQDGVDFFLTPELVKYIVETTDERSEFGARPVIDRYESLVLAQLGEHIGSGAIQNDSFVRVGLGEFDEENNEPTIEFRSVLDPLCAEPDTPSAHEVELYRPSVDRDVMADIATLAVRDEIKQILSGQRSERFTIIRRDLDDEVARKGEPA